MKLRNCVKEENEQILKRKAKLNRLRAIGQAYPNDFKRDSLAFHLHTTYGQYTEETLIRKTIDVKMAGRMMIRRLIGKASFIHIQDMTGRMQIYVSQDKLLDDTYSEFKDWDLGDILGIEGALFKTKTGELSVKAKKIRLLAKALRPMPDKFRGLNNQEHRVRQRYLDLIVNKTSYHLFQVRSYIVTQIRRFLDDRGFIEVETPMMHPLVGGAAARPFKTHHNAMNMDLYLRIAPELYLKRLVIGGFENVYEINRNFRNEGISSQHNPEFTMLEFYQAYATYKDMMILTEEMIRYLANKIFGRLKIIYQNIEIDLKKPFLRLSLREAILQFNPDIKSDQIDDFRKATNLAKRYEISIPKYYGLGKIQTELFKKLVEEKLQQPIFITHFPKEVSPLSRSNEIDNFVTDRFEFYVGGREIANGFSELNDPEDQATRFREQLQARSAGDLEAMDLDEDYITALEYGLPPTGGEGIGIDRLVTLFVDKLSIRDVILFPLLRAKSMSRN
ncbi:lysine--tRNA ligase [Coxiella endosymbiont of Amblyomma americanum]|uniref:lysine--tRNA ligase n=1 Tax=Coxiella endosymbiont of Amblyomma americanum TaxID=325775 RepID=UPI00057DC871|nr:lysine--tRNA ligase [Coxiella endosymbiont of Amblyomma americanum]AJC50490.1 lysyl-tRNA synthetase [Coxiella endosymbiont of Amblyomma americanum]AUJ58827.1 lysine--tRNA ligase [Coxiella-like endosymbiont of Amblyomma americanum]